MNVTNVLQYKNMANIRFVICLSYFARYTLNWLEYLVTKGNLIYQSSVETSTMIIYIIHLVKRYAIIWFEMLNYHDKKMKIFNQNSIFFSAARTHNCYDNISNQYIYLKMPHATVVLSPDSWSRPYLHKYCCESPR